MYGVADVYSDALGGSSSDVCSGEAGAWAWCDDGPGADGGWSVGLCDGAWSGFLGSKESGGLCRTSDCAPGRQPTRISAPRCSRPRLTQLTPSSRNR